MSDAALKPALRRLDRVNTPGARRAVLLALLQTPGSARERQAWEEETLPLPDARQWQDLVATLPAEARLPCFEHLLRRGAEAGRDERTELLRSARRVMCADGKVRALDRWRWLLMRHVLSPRRAADHDGAAPPPHHAEQALADLPESARWALAHLTAYLARLVPQADPAAKVGTAGVAWYRAVLRTFWFDGAPACQLPDGDALMHALAGAQALSWTQRPVLVRAWVHTALKVQHRLWRGQPLPLEAAEALRIASDLLDSPLHPALAERFIEMPAGDPPRH